nr:unnamed protein product [Spirometra erinaceieuropaei]
MWGAFFFLVTAFLLGSVSGCACPLSVVCSFESLDVLISKALLDWVGRTQDSLLGLLRVCEADESQAPVPPSSTAHDIPPSQPPPPPSSAELGLVIGPGSHVTLSGASQESFSVISSHQPIKSLSTEPGDRLSTSGPLPSASVPSVTASKTAADTDFFTGVSKQLASSLSWLSACQLDIQLQSSSILFCPSEFPPALHPSPSRSFPTRLLRACLSKSPPPATLLELTLPQLRLRGPSAGRSASSEVISPVKSPRSPSGASFVFQENDLLRSSSPPPPPVQSPSTPISTSFTWGLQALRAGVSVAGTRLAAGNLSVTMSVSQDDVKEEAGAVPSQPSPLVCNIFCNATNLASTGGEEDERKLFYCVASRQEGDMSAEHLRSLLLTAFLIFSEFEAILSKVSIVSTTLHRTFAVRQPLCPWIAKTDTSKMVFSSPTSLHQQRQCVLGSDRVDRLKPAPSSAVNNQPDDLPVPTLSVLFQFTLSSISGRICLQPLEAGNAVSWDLEGLSLTVNRTDSMILFLSRIDRFVALLRTKEGAAAAAEAVLKGFNLSAEQPAPDLAATTVTDASTTNNNNSNSSDSCGRTTISAADYLKIAALVSQLPDLLEAAQSPASLIYQIQQKLLSGVFSANSPIVVGSCPQTLAAKCLSQPASSQQTPTKGVNATSCLYTLVRSVRDILVGHGFQELREDQVWKLRPNDCFYITKNRSSIFAVAVGGAYKPGNGFSIIGAHTDSPCLRLKPISERVKEGFVQLAVETYGGGLWYSWFDRDLTVAGRCLVRLPSGALEERLVHINRPIACVPSLAIHLNRDANKAFSPNPEQHLAPILCTMLTEQMANSPELAVGGSALAADMESEKPHSAMDAAASSQSLPSGSHPPALLKCARHQQRDWLDDNAEDIRNAFAEKNKMPRVYIGRRTDQLAERIVYSSVLTNSPLLDSIIEAGEEGATERLTVKVNYRFRTPEDDKEDEKEEVKFTGAATNDCADTRDRISTAFLADSPRMLTDRDIRLAKFQDQCIRLTCQGKLPGELTYSSSANITASGPTASLTGTTTTSKVEQLLELIRIIYQISGTQDRPLSDLGNAAQPVRAAFCTPDDEVDTEQQTRAYDFLAASGLNNDLAPEHFISYAISRKLIRQLMDPLSVVSSTLPDWCFNLPRRLSVLFPYEVRLNLLTSSAFGVARSVIWLQNHVARSTDLTTNVQRSHNRHHSIESSISNRLRNNEAARLAAGLATYLMSTPCGVRNGGAGHDQLSDLTLFSSCTGSGASRRRRPSTFIATHQSASGTLLSLDRLSRRRDACDCSPHDIGRLHKEFIQIPRDGAKAASDNEGERSAFWEWADRVLDEHASRKSELEIQFIGEQGTGIGPTLEFFSLVATELRRKTGRMWVVNEEDFEEPASVAATTTDQHVSSTTTPCASLLQPGPSSSSREEPEVGEDNVLSSEATTYVKAANGLFPAPYPMDKIPESVVRRFYIMGIAVAKCLQDNRRIDLPLSTPFLKLISAFGNVQGLDMTSFAPEETIHDQMKRLVHSEQALDRINVRSTVTQIIDVNTSHCSRGHWITGLLDFDDFWSIDPERGRFFFQLCQFCQRKRRLQSIFPANGLTLEWLENAAIEVLGCKISDLSLEMEFIPSGQYSTEVVPLLDHYSWESSAKAREALDDSVNEVDSVTVYNVEDYIRRTLEYCLDKGIRVQMDAFRGGLSCAVVVV